MTAGVTADTDVSTGRDNELSNYLQCVSKVLLKKKKKLILQIGIF